LQEDMSAVCWFWFRRY